MGSDRPRHHSIESRYRINAPNSKRPCGQGDRARPTERRVVKSLSERQWNGATFFTASAFGAAPAKGRKLCGLAERSRRPHQEPGGGSHRRRSRCDGRAGEPGCRRGLDRWRGVQPERVNTTALVLQRTEHFRRGVIQDSIQLRPWSLMLVISSAEEYVTDMLSALRA